MSFDDLVKSDMKNTILNTSELAESITYTPKGGTSKTIDAIIVRELMGPDQYTGHSNEKAAEIYILNDATDGVDTVNPGYDKVTFPEIVGESDIVWSVSTILDKDVGSWHLKVRR